MDATETDHGVEIEKTEVIGAGRQVSLIYFFGHETDWI